MSVKCLHATVLASLSEYLLPLQVGVKVPNAAEKVAHEVKAWVDESVPGELILQVDMKNAFNTLDRIALLEEVKARSPLLYPYAASCYSQPAVLFGPGFTLPSKCGVQQGDVCGPALFALALQRLVL